MTGKVGVAISTYRRPAVLAAALSRWAGAMPDVLVVNHDVHGEGVACMKNVGIAALVDAHCDHLILADDDCSPVTQSWACHYIESQSPHLMHCWGKSRLVKVEAWYSVWSWPRGCLLYATREVVERVGGMRPDFAGVGGEHVEWSRRIHNAGFTPYPFMDSASARKGVWHYEGTAPSTLGRARYDDPALVERRRGLLKQYADSTEYVDYRT